MCYKGRPTTIFSACDDRSWEKRLTSSIFGMYCVDAWLMYRECTTDTLHTEPDLNQK